MPAFRASTAVATLLLAGAAHAACPDVGAQPNLNLTAYAAHRWFIQELMPIKYEPVEFNFCTTAQYTLRSDGGIAVRNSDRNGSVTAPPREANLCAVVASASEPAKLKVGPCFLPSIFYGDYWVVRASQFGRTGSEPGARTDSYDWAIVSGGQPTIPGTDGCRTGTDVNQSGLWIFSRDPITPADELARIRDIAHSVGFDITVLNPVTQQGCTYNSAPAPAGNLRGAAAVAVA